MPGASCDRAWAELSGWLCYQKIPGTQIQLYFDRNGSPIETASQLGLTMPRVGEAPRNNPLSASTHRVGK